MSDLPSREGVAIDLALAEVDLSDAPLHDILVIAAEWSSGRLVDRKAIATAIDWALSDDVTPDEFAQRIAAAFGDTDE